MSQDPFRPQISLALRIAVTAGMGISGLVFGLSGMRELDQSWPVSVIAGIVCSAPFSFVAWRRPELFFKNRP